MFAKKGKRKIVVDGETYHWCVTVDQDTGIEPMTLSVFSDQKYLFGVNFHYGREIRTPVNLVYKGETSQGFSLTYEDHPEITPALVRALILKYKNFTT